MYYKNFLVPFYTAFVNVSEGYGETISYPTRFSNEKPNVY